MRKQEWVGRPFKWDDHNRESIIKLIKNIMINNRISMAAAWNIFNNEILESNYDCPSSRFCKTIYGDIKIPAYQLISKWIKDEKIQMPETFGKKSKNKIVKTKKIENDDLTVKEIEAVGLREEIKELKDMITELRNDFKDFMTYMMT